MPLREMKHNSFPPATDLPGVVGFRGDLRCEIVTDFAVLERLASDWQRLWNCWPLSEVFQSFPWIKAFWRAYGEEVSLRTPVVYHGSQVVGILPLALKGGTLSFLGPPHSDYNDVVCDPAFAAEVIRASFEALGTTREWQCCMLENLRADSQILLQLSALPDHLRPRAGKFFQSPCATVLAEDPQVYAELARKKNLRRHESKLRSMGQLTFRHLECRKEIKAQLAEYFQTQITRRAMLAQVSAFLHWRYRAFYEALVEELEPRTVLRFGVLELNRQPLAYHFGFEAKNKFIIYQPAFNVDFWNCYPGEVLMQKLFQYAHQKAVREIDFTLGGEAYKNRYANVRRENFVLYIDQPTNHRRFVASVVRPAEARLRRSREKARNYPGLYDALKVSARALRQERQRFRIRGARGYAMEIVLRCLQHLRLYDKMSGFVVRREGVPLGDTAMRAPVTVTALTLRSAALASIEYPELGSQLDEIRKRLGAGNRLFLVTEGPRPVQMWASSTCSQQVGDEPALVPRTHLLEEWWWAPRSHGIRAIGQLLQLMPDSNEPIVVCCRKSSANARQIAASGVSASFRRTRLRWWLRATAKWLRLPVGNRT